MTSLGELRNNFSRGWQDMQNSTAWVLKINTSPNLTIKKSVLHLKSQSNLKTIILWAKRRSVDVISVILVAHTIADVANPIKSDSNSSTLVDLCTLLAIIITIMPFVSVTGRNVLSYSHHNCSPKISALFCVVFFVEIHQLMIRWSALSLPWRQETERSKWIVSCGLASYPITPQPEALFTHSGCPHL